MATTERARTSPDTKNKRKGEKKPEPAAPGVLAEDPADVPAPFSPRTARRVAWAERSAYTVLGSAATVLPQMDTPYAVGAGLGAALLGSLTTRHLWVRAGDRNWPRLATACQRALPLLGLSISTAAAAIYPGTPWWEIAAPLGITAASLAGLPFTRSRGIRHRANEGLPQLPETAEEVPGVADAPTPYAAALARAWAASPATHDTHLEQIVQYSPDRPDFEALIVAAVGTAVPRTIDHRAVGSIYDVPDPEQAITFKDVPGRGPGYRAVRVAPSTVGAPAGSLEEALQGAWEQRVSPPTGLAPGLMLVAIRVEHDRIALRVEAEGNARVRLSRETVIRVVRPILGIADPGLVMVETGITGAVVTIYAQHPLENIRPAIAEDLTMDEQGYIRLGLRHDGRPDPWRLYDPALGGVTDLIAGASGSGKSGMLLTLLTAERLSGVVSIVADAQNGMSLPEADGQIAHFGKGIAAVGATLSALCAVMDHRERISTENGWSNFVLGDPWRLIMATLDEVNLVLGNKAEVDPAYRNWVAGMITRVQFTGRKLGAGIRLGAQRIHVTELAGSEQIRSGAKRGNVWLGRIDSERTPQMATDLEVDTSDVVPIPRTFGADDEEKLAAAWDGAEVSTEGASTAGMANHIGAGGVALMRVWRAERGPDGRGYPHLTHLMDQAPLPGLTEQEQRIFDEVYAAALPACERAAAGIPEPKHEDDAEGEEDEDTPSPQTPRAQTSLTKTSAPPAAPQPSVADRLLDALAETTGPQHIRQLRAAVQAGTEGGPSSGSVSNALSRLAETGKVVRLGGGRWALPGAEE